jgi:hypothetical protein
MRESLVSIGAESAALDTSARIPQDETADNAVFCQVKGVECFFQFPSLFTGELCARGKMADVPPMFLAQGGGGEPPNGARKGQACNLSKSLMSFFI